MHLPKCLAEIRKHEESQEQYWAREVVWAVHHIENRGDTVSFRKIRELTNIRRKNLERCMSYIQDYWDTLMFEQGETLAQYEEKSKIAHLSCHGNQVSTHM